ncbi:hypothetical protein [Archaeoglobus sp.]
MIRLRLAVVLVALFIIVVSVAPSNAVIVKVEEISNYKITVNTDNGHVKCEITIKNLINNPVVPGVGELRLQKQEPRKILIFPIPNTNVAKTINVSNVKAYSGKMSIPVKVIYKKDYTVIQYEIWTPIEPKKSFSFTIEFDAPELVDRGILFKSVTIPIGADVDIAHLELKPVSSWHLCYASPKMNDDRWIAKIPANHMEFFTAEFSSLPLPMLPVRGYVAFWGSLMIIILIIAVVVWLKRQKNVPQ